MLLNMKRLISIVLAGATLLLGLGSCMKEEDRAIFDPSQCTAPVLNGYDVVEGAVSATYTPATLNTNPKILNHMLAIVSLDGNAVSKRVNSTDKDGVLSVSATNLTRALQELGCEEGSTHSLEMAIRASNLKTPDDQNPGSYIESVAHIVIDAYEIILPSGDPYARYTQPSEWSLIGSFNDWGGDYEMWTNGTLHVAKAVQLDANAEVKFRKDASWDVNFGYAEGISSYVLGEEFDLSQGGANIVIAEAGVYDFILDPENATAKIIKSVAPQDDPYAGYTETSPWSVIGSFNGWGGDEEMVTNGTLHVCKNITLAAGDEFKFRKDAGWDVNFGYADGVTSYTLGEEFALGQGGANIIIAEDGAYDLILDPENATATIIKTKVIDVDPYAAYTETSPWSVIGSFNSWGGDEEMVTNGTLHVCKAIALNAGDEWKFRFEHDWAVNFGYAEGVTTYTLGEEFEVAQDGGNIIVLEDGVYDFILDPENATAKVIKSIAKDSGDVPPPQPKPKAWSVTGTLEDSGWEKDYDLTNVSGDMWTIKNLYVREKDEFKIRADHDWAKSYGGPEENAESTYEEGNVYGVYQPVLGETFEAGGKNIRIGVEGNYNITFTYGDTPTILIEEYKEFPEHLYMTGTDFGDWSWGEGTVELWPVINKPDWDGGKSAEGQFYTIRYFTKNGFKLNGARAWDNNQFGSLNTNHGFTNDGDGNIIVPEEGIYLVHVDLKNSILNVEPAKVYGIGDAFGAWDEAMENALFKADGQTLKVTAQKAGKLRMYVASDIATTSWWTREFNIIDGQLVPRVLDELQGVPDILAGQVVTLDFNAGTGTITGEGEAPAYKTEISVPGAYSGSEWNLDTAPKLLGKGDGEYKGALTMYKQGDAAVEFKFGHDGTWIGGTADGLNFTLGVGDNMTLDEGTYFWTVNLEAKTATALKVEKVGLIGSFNQWSDDVVLRFDAADCTYNGTVTLEANAELKVRFNGNWDYSMGGELTRLSAVEGNVKVADAGEYDAKLDLNKGTLTLTPKGGQPAASITIDGDMSEWAGVTDQVSSTKEEPVYMLFKVANDDEYIYFYSKRDNRSAIWNRGGYIYYDIDADNNPETGVDKEIPGLEMWLYFFPFDAEGTIATDIGSGSAYPSKDVFNSFSFAGAVSETFVEIEARMTLSDAGVKKGDVIAVYTWSNKSGDDLKKTPITYTVK